MKQEFDFELHKRNILSRPDKSRKGSIDNRIVELCNIINSTLNYCTSSSCSGRILIIEKASKKHQVKYIYVSHELVSKDDIKPFFIFDSNRLLQAQSMILHVQCKDSESAQLLLQYAKDIGLRRSGIITLHPYTVELVSDEVIQVPMIFPAKMLNEDFLEKLCIEMNIVLENSWSKIKMLEKYFKN